MMADFPHLETVWSLTGQQNELIPVADMEPPEKHHLLLHR